MSIKTQRLLSRAKKQITKGEINDTESKYIVESKKAIESKDNWFSINYTGENQRLIK